MTGTAEVSTAEFGTLRVEIDPTSEGRIGRLTLDQPAKLNPLGSTALREIAEAAAWFDSTDASVVIVTGEGRAFSSGFDLREFADPDSATSNPRDSADLGRRMAEALDRMAALTIAAIKGPCVGGGVVLAAACDLRIAADDTVFSIPEVDLGIPLAWGGIPRLVREIGPAMTRELVLTCRPFDADEARSHRLRQPRRAAGRPRGDGRRTRRAAGGEGAQRGAHDEAPGQRSPRRRCRRPPARGPMPTCWAPPSATPRRGPPPARTSARREPGLIPVDR